MENRLAAPAPEAVRSGSKPVTIAAVQATTQGLEGKSVREIADYLVVLGIFDVVFFALALIVFDYLVEE